MRFEVYQAPPTPTTPRIRLQLQQEGDTVNLMGITEEGREWYLIKFTPGHNPILCSQVPPELGFDLDSDGCCLTENE